MANDQSACIYFALWVYIIFRCVTLFFKVNDVWWCPLWPVVTYSMFIFTRMVENCCLNVKVYIFVIVPINIVLFGSGVTSFFFCSECLSDSMVIYLIVFSLQCIQMLIFVCMLTILIVEGISITQIINHDSGFYDENESLLGKGLSDDEIHAVVQNKPEKVGKDDTCSICLCDFNNESINEVEDVMQFKSCKHMFHSNCISGWLCRDSRCPNCNNDVKNELY